MLTFVSHGSAKLIMLAVHGTNIISFGLIWLHALLFIFLFYIYLEPLDCSLPSLCNCVVSNK